jgi:hypothetical protein
MAASVLSTARNALAQTPTTVFRAVTRGGKCAAAFSSKAERLLHLEEKYGAHNYHPLPGR